MTQKIVVIDHKGGNLASAAKSVTHAAQMLGLDCDVQVSSSPEELLLADRLILPGQGAFMHCAEAINGPLWAAIETATGRGTPYLGICVGMQLMAERGLEHGVTLGFGWIKGSVAPMDNARQAGLRLPHIGWNDLQLAAPSHPLLAGIKSGDHGYFVHSYALTDYMPGDVIAYTSYGADIPAIVVRGNRCGTQFHVEKSQQVGLRFLQNFLTWSPMPDTV